MSPDQIPPHGTERPVRRVGTVVIGAGQAGPGVAAALAADGEQVVLVEGERFGGTCLNTGCRPTKALRASARAAHAARSSADLGVTASEVTVDFTVVMTRIRRLLDSWRTGALDHYRGTDGLEYLEGRGRLAGRDGDDLYVTVDTADGEVGFVASRVVLNTGASSVPPRLDGLDSVPWLDHRSVLELDELPASFAVIGGSYIGLEFAQIYRRLGAEVTVIEPSSHLISREDPEVSDAVAHLLGGEGIDLRLGRRPVAVRPGPDGAGVVVELDDASEVRAAALLVAVGRRPNTADLGLDLVGVELDDHGYVVVDDVFRSNVPGVYAVGDVNGRGAFTHTSYQDHEILVDHLRGGPRTVAGRRATYALFTDPPLGRVGMTAREAEAAGYRVRTTTMPAGDITLAALEGEREGIVVLVADDATGALLGAAALCLHGDELASTFSAFMHAGATAQQMREWLPIHPTISEFVPTLVARLDA